MALGYWLTTWYKKILIEDKPHRILLNKFLLFAEFDVWPLKNEIESGWWIHNATCRQCTPELYTWNICVQCHSNEFNSKKVKNKNKERKQKSEMDEHERVNLRCGWVKTFSCRIICLIRSLVEALYKMS